MFQSLPPAEVHAIARDYFQTCLNQALEWSLDLPRDGSDLDNEIELLDADMSSTRDALKRKKFAPMLTAQADELLAAHLPAGRKPDGDTRNLMREAVTRAHLEQLRFLVASLTGDFAETEVQDPIFKGMKPTGTAHDHGHSASPSFAEACETFIASRMQSSALWTSRVKLISYAEAGRNCCRLRHRSGTTFSR
jgi:hypothetical protein